MDRGHCTSKRIRLDVGPIGKYRARYKSSFRKRRDVRNVDSVVLSPACRRPEIYYLAVNLIRASSFSAARPESMDSPAVTAPSLKCSAFPAATSAAAAFISTTSRLGDFSPPKISRTMRAFSAASPPERDVKGAVLKPNSSGEIS